MGEPDWTLSAAASTRSNDRRTQNKDLVMPSGYEPILKLLECLQSAGVQVCKKSCVCCSVVDLFKEKGCTVGGLREGLLKLIQVIDSQKPQQESSSAVSSSSSSAEPPLLLLPETPAMLPVPGATSTPRPSARRCTKAKTAANSRKPASTPSLTATSPWPPPGATNGRRIRLRRDLQATLQPEPMLPPVVRVHDDDDWLSDSPEIVASFSNVSRGAEAGSKTATSASSTDGNRNGRWLLHEDVAMIEGLMEFLPTEDASTMDSSDKNNPALSQAFSTVATRLNRTEASVISRWQNYVRPALLSFAKGKLYSNDKAEIVSFLVEKRVPSARNIPWEELKEKLPHHSIESMKNIINKFAFDRRGGSPNDLLWQRLSRLLPHVASRRLTNYQQEHKDGLVFAYNRCLCKRRLKRRNSGSEEIVE